MKKRTLRSLALTVAFLLVVAACGDDDDSSAPAAQPSTTMAGGTGGDMSDERADIVDTAVAAGGFTTLVAAVQAAGLEETLRGPGPFTVFAPTDEAFDALPEGTLDSLLADPTGDLAEILTYHVVDGAVRAADVVGLDGKEITTVNGAKIRVSVDGDTVTLTDQAGNEATVTSTDVEASNGVIHVIDAVLMPA